MIASHLDGKPISTPKGMIKMRTEKSKRRNPSPKAACLAAIVCLMAIIQTSAADFDARKHGIRIGWANDGAIRNCSFSNIVMHDTVRGIGIILPGIGNITDYGREATP